MSDAEDSADPPSPTLPPALPPEQQPEFRRIFEARVPSTYNLTQPTAPENVRRPPRPPPHVRHDQAPAPGHGPVVAAPRLGRPAKRPPPSDESDDDDIQFVQMSPPKRPRAQVGQGGGSGVSQRAYPSPTSAGSRSTPIDLDEDDTPLREISPPTTGRGPRGSGRARPGQALSEDVKYNIARLVNGTNAPLTHISRLHPELDSWERVTRFVGARPEDAERVRHTTAAWMRLGPARARDAKIL